MAPVASKSTTFGQLVSVHHLADHLYMSKWNLSKRHVSKLFHYRNHTVPPVHVLSNWKFIFYKFPFLIGGVVKISYYITNLILIMLLIVYCLLIQIHFTYFDYSFTCFMEILHILFLSLF